MRIFAARTCAQNRRAGRAANTKTIAARWVHLSRIVWIIILTLTTTAIVSVAHAETSRIAEREADTGSSQKVAAEIVLRHLYAVYFGLRACTEMSVRENDGSYRSEVSLDGARQTLRSIDAAAAESSIDSSAIWAATAPLAIVTAEALKREPAKT